MSIYGENRVKYNKEEEEQKLPIIIIISIPFDGKTFGLIFKKKANKKMHHFWTKEKKCYSIVALELLWVSKINNLQFLMYIVEHR